MKILFSTLLVTLVGCGSTRFDVGSETPAALPAEDCSSSCQATVTCSPNGNCVIQCTGDGGQQCEIELACDGTTCEVVRTDCSGSSCGPTNSNASAPK